MKIKLMSVFSLVLITRRDNGPNPNLYIVHYEFTF